MSDLGSIYPGYEDDGPTRAAARAAATKSNPPEDPADKAAKDMAAANAVRQAEFDKLYAESSGFLGEASVGVGRGAEVGGQAYADELRNLLISGRATAQQAIDALKTLSAEAMASNYPTYTQNADGSYTDSGNQNNGNNDGERTSALTAIRSVLAEFGLESIADYLYGEYTSKRLDISNRAALLYAARSQEAYQQRFSANARRKAAGLPELDPFEYLRIEGEYRQTLRTLGMPTDLVSFNDLIAGDVSNAELKDRIEDGYKAVAEADPATKDALRRIYDVSDSQLATYFLDPKRGMTEIKRAAEAAKVAGGGFTGLGLTLGKTEAENVLAMGYTAQQARAKFTEAGALRGLYEEQGTEDALSVSEKVGAAIGYDPLAAQKLERRKQLRKAQFLGGGRFVGTTGATSGSIETGVGTSQ